MKQNCDIIRDLMPMCIDGTASEKSCALVEEHIGECAACMQIYTEMQQEPAREAPRPAEDFSAAVRGLRRRKRLRTMLVALAAAAACLVIAAVSFGAWMYLRETYVQVAQDEIAVSLSRRANGEILVNRKQEQPREVRMHLTGPDKEGVVRLSFETPRLADRLYAGEMATTERHNRLYWVEGEGLCYASWVAAEHDFDLAPLEWGVFFVRTEQVYEPISELWYGDTLLYRRGDEIPPASAELEAFMLIYDQYRGTGRQEYAVISLTSFVTISREEQVRYANCMFAPCMPEWQ